LIEPANSLDHEYAKIVSVVENLPGTVVCPEDPTIPLYAKGYPGQNIFSENDTHLVSGKWPTEVPETVLADCRSANYLVDIPSLDPVHDQFLRDLSFELAPELAPDLRDYRIWRRKTSNTSPETQSRTALNATSRIISD
jgi:hypothetical protein